MLKKKKFLEKNLENTDGQLDNLEHMVSSIEYKQIEIQVVNGLKIGNDCLKNLNQMLSLDDVEKIMDDTHESIEYQNVISFAFSQWVLK
jgi:charged multivesicular body protein 6